MNPLQPKPVGRNFTYGNQSLTTGEQGKQFIKVSQPGNGETILGRESAQLDAGTRGVQEHMGKI